MNIQRTNIKRLGTIAAALTLAAAAVTGCGSSSSDSAATNAATTAAAAAPSTEATSGNDGTAAAGNGTTAEVVSTSGGGGAAPSGEGGPGGFGKNVDASSITTVDELNALINEAYGDAGLGLHRGHQPVEQVLIDTLGISHDEMHVRMDAGQNLSAIAEDQGVGTQTLIDALVANWQPAIDNLENEGLIDADQAAQYHEALVDAFTFKVTWNGTDEAPTFSGV